jgi:hypothetical protein
MPGIDILPLRLFYQTIALEGMHALKTNEDACGYKSHYHA